MAADATEVDGESVLLTGWGHTSPSRADLYQPRTPFDVERLLKGAERGAIARGLGRSYGDAAQNGGGRVLDMTSFSGIRAIDLDGGTVTAAAGTSLDTLMRQLVPLGWFVPVTPGTRFVTVGGAIAADIHGKNHHREGSFCDHVVELELLTPAGDRVRASSTSNPDVFWATAGGMGLTGVVLEATIQLLPIETSLMRVDTDRVPDIDDLMARLESGDDAYRYSVAWIDTLARGRHLGRAVLTRGDHASLEELGGRRRDPRAFAPRNLLTAPPGLPSGLVRPITSGAFNEVWYRKAPRHEIGRLHTITAFFHPLDGVREWNRVYGKRGFLQYQFVVPPSAGDVLRTALERFSAARAPSFLAVLKRFGPEHGFLSFPMPGWTLTVDVPTTMPGLGPLLDGLDELVVEAGGRVYFAKDSRVRPGLVPSMYPRLVEWRSVRERLDPHGVMQSDLARRVGL